jgi:hypothetical protein
MKCHGACNVDIWAALHCTGNQGQHIDIVKGWDAKSPIAYPTTSWMLPAPRTLTFLALQR